MKVSFDSELQRRQLVRFLRQSGALRNPLLEKAFLTVPREKFVASPDVKSAYEDIALPIGYRQTISQPTTIAFELELLEVQEGQKILEVGSGSGYVCALLATMVGSKGKVFGIEFLKELVTESKKKVKQLKLKNVKIVQGDGSGGLPKQAPFDRILVSAACPYLPKPLFDQLKERGIAVAPVGDLYAQAFEVFTKVDGKLVKKEASGMEFAFVPLRGKHGFSKDWF